MLDTLNIESKSFKRNII